MTNQLLHKMRILIVLALCMCFVSCHGHKAHMSAGVVIYKQYTAPSFLSQERYTVFVKYKNDYIESRLCSKNSFFTLEKGDSVICTDYY